MSRELGMEAFKSYLEKHPKALESMERKEAEEAFKTEFHVDKKSKFYCPICSEYMHLSRLFQSVEDPDVYVCRDCQVKVRLEVIAIPVVTIESEEGKLHDPHKYDYLEKEGREESGKVKESS